MGWIGCFWLCFDANFDGQVWCTVQFGHNDQKPATGISITQYEANLEKMVTELRGLGANVVGFFFYLSNKRVWMKAL